MLIRPVNKPSKILKLLLPLTKYKLQASESCLGLHFELQALALDPSVQDNVLQQHSSHPAVYRQPKLSTNPVLCISCWLILVAL